MKHIRVKFSEIARKLLYLVQLKNNPRIIVASTGRAGSTVLYKALCESYTKKRCLTKKETEKRIRKRIDCGFIKRLKKDHKKLPKIIKTHDLFHDDTYPKNSKAIFVYGDPLDSLLSVEQMTKKYGLQWFYQHQYNLRAEGSFEKLYHDDVLNFEGQIKSWMRQKRSNVLCIKYEDIWERKKDIEAFTGLSISLPPQKQRTKKERQNKIDQKLIQHLRRTLKKHEKYIVGSEY